MSIEGIQLGVIAVALMAVGMTSAPLLAQGGNGQVVFEIVSVDIGSSVVTARDVNAGRNLRFKLSPQTFVGTTFRAVLDTERGSASVVYTGGPVTADNAELQGELERGRAAPRPGRPVGDQFRITRIDVADGMYVVQARGEAGTIELRNGPRAFAGYRFVANLEDLKDGGALRLMPGPNAIPNCCTLSKAPG